MNLRSLHKNSCRIGTGLRIMLGCELLRILIPRTRVNKGLIPPSVLYIEPWVTLSLLGVEAMLQGKEVVRISEQARKVKNKAIPEWAEGLYYNKGMFTEVLAYYDDESIYFECKGKDSGIVRFTFERSEEHTSELQSRGH